MKENVELRPRDVDRKKGALLDGLGAVVNTTPPIDDKAAVMDAISVAHAHETGEDITALAPEQFTNGGRRFFTREKLGIALEAIEASKAAPEQAPTDLWRTSTREGVVHGIPPERPETDSVTEGLITVQERAQRDPVRSVGLEIDEEQYPHAYMNVLISSHLQDALDDSGSDTSDLARRMGTSTKKVERILNDPTANLTLREIGTASAALGIELNFRLVEDTKSE